MNKQQIFDNNIKKLKETEENGKKIEYRRINVEGEKNITIVKKTEGEEKEKIFIFNPEKENLEETRYFELKPEMVEKLEVELIRRDKSIDRKNWNINSAIRLSKKLETKEINRLKKIKKKNKIIEHIIKERKKDRANIKITK